MTSKQARAKDGDDIEDTSMSACGEFDQDESEETVAMVRASKSTMLRGPGLTVVGPLQAAKADSSGRHTEDVRYPLFYKLEASD